MNKKKVGFIGYGKIVRDKNPKQNNYILTHEHAINEISNLEVTSIFDIGDIDSPIATNNINDFFQNDLDLITIASPTNLHIEHFEKAIQSNAKYILLEKPLTHKKEELERFKKLFPNDKHITLNYPRHFDKSISSLSKSINDNIFGKCLHFDGILTKGFIHNGSHLFDLLGSFFGNNFELSPINVQKQDDDFMGEIRMSYSNFSGLLKCIPQTDYSLFETTLYFEKARISIKNSARVIEISHSEESDLYNGFEELTKNELLKETLGSSYLNTYTTLISEEKSLLDQKINNWITQIDKLITLKDAI